ncbi:MAG: single-stranded-DNA-specific exonuclease RecJ [Nitrospinae bacterium]|nr:single-stranded-DNA-specific exonuclease RecJ [Nitrospinota bacterium]
MKPNQKNWIIAAPDQERVSELSHSLGVPPLLARVLVLRGLADPAAASSFLNAPLRDMHDPFLMKGMRRAVDRIFQAIQRKESIWVYADYDVDGVASAALMVHFFREIGCPIDYYIPNRMSDGYGLKEKAVVALKEKGAALVITADCGIGAAREIQKAAELGMEVIVTDHHQVPEELPPAMAILNPLQEDCPYPYKFLSGAGIIYKLLIGLRAELREKGRLQEIPNLKKHLDLVALATIADLVPLTGENHILARHGLEELSSTKKIGLRALKSVSGLMEKKLNSYSVGFQLAPRLNAAGRLGEADRGVRLLVSLDMAKAMESASELDRENRERQEFQEKVVEEARLMVKKSVNLNTEFTIVLASEEWHPGVIGIAASKIVDSFHRPVVLITVENGVGKGSARSIGPFNIYKGLRECAGLLREFGGHEAAAGLTIDADKISVFRSKFAQVAAEALRPEDLVKNLRADGEINLDELDMDAVRRLEALGPFGISNPAPAFVARNVKPIGKVVRIGQNKNHIKFLIQNSRGIQIEAVGFRMERFFSKIDSENASFDVLFNPQVNEWNGRVALQLKLLDCRVREEA